MAVSISRRQFARFLCKFPLKIIGLGAPEALEGLMLNVGMGGAYVRVAGTLRPGATKFRVTVGTKAVMMAANLVRTGGLDPTDSKVTYYGLEFPRDRTTEKRARFLVETVRGAAQPDGHPTTPDYWKKSA